MGRGSGDGMRMTLEVVLFFVMWEMRRKRFSDEQERRGKKERNKTTTRAIWRFRHET
jgi:hypothetical protein